MELARVVAWILIAVLLPWVAAAANPPKSITVFGQNDPSVDRQAVQDAVEAVRRNGTVNLVGVFQFDGENVRVTRGKLTLAGLALDNDADGSINEDWADGADNDGDGWVDEDDWDAEIRGLDDGSGGPATALMPTYFNSALTVVGGTGVLKMLTIRDIKFTRNSRAIWSAPDYLFDESRSCEQVVPLDASLSKLRIQGSFFGNNYSALILEGASRDAELTRNVFFDNLRIHLLVAGGTTACVGPEGWERLPLGTPENTIISDNLVAGIDRGTWGYGNRPFGLWTVETERSKIRRNGFAELSIALVTQRDKEARVEQNVVSGAAFGIIGEWPADNVRVLDNSFENVEIGVLLGHEASGYYAENNHFTNVSEVDYYLVDSSSANTIVLTEPGSTVIDLGTGNTIIEP